MARLIPGGPMLMEVAGTRQRFIPGSPLVMNDFAVVTTPPVGPDGEVPVLRGGVRGGGKRRLTLREYIDNITQKVEAQAEVTPRREKKRIKLQRIVVDDQVESLPEVLDLRKELASLYDKTTPLLPTDIATLQLIFARIELMRKALLQDDQDVMDLIRLLDDDT